MVESRLHQIVRQFAENGMRLLLENPQNVCDLLGLSVPDIVQMIDSSRLKPIQTTFVQRDYRHVESDVVLVAPLRRRKGKRLARRLLIYILIELAISARSCVWSSRGNPGLASSSSF
jgi:hypothetical protein